MSEAHSQPCFNQIAPQHILTMHEAVGQVIAADYVLFDFDDTIARHVPEAQFWLALHTLASRHGGTAQFEANLFEKNYTNGFDHPETQGYLETVRDISRSYTGSSDHFERVANSFRVHANNGEVVKAALKTIPGYESSGTFWQARAQLFLESSVSPAYGKQLMPGVSALLRQLQLLSKNLGVISNSRMDLIVPALEQLLPGQNGGFHEVRALGGTAIPIKPDPEIFAELQRQDPGLNSQNTVYIGNAHEDVAFAKAVGMPVIIFGPAFDNTETADAHFITDTEAYATLLRRHTDGAALARIASRKGGEILGFEGLRARDIQPHQVPGVVANGLKSFWGQHLRQSIEAISSNLWGSEQYSLRQLENFCDHFGVLMGEMQVNALGPNEIIREYYTEERLDSHNNSLALRGASYYAVVDDRFESTAERAAFIGEELGCALETITKIHPEELTLQDLLPYLGILDNAKQQMLTLFHAFTHHERRKGIDVDAHYQALRKEALEQAIQITRAFYEACIGYRPAKLDPDRTAELVKKLQPYLKNVKPEAFKLQELDHPLRIMLSAYGLAEKEADTIIGFPSGGTQLAIATALASEIRHHRSDVDVLSVPLSLHSGAKQSARPISDEHLVASLALMQKSLQGCRVMIVDDNSSTGATLERGIRAVELFQPQVVDAGVCELDPQRLLMRRRQGEMFRSVDLQHAIFKVAAGVVPVTGNDIQMRKRFAQRVITRNRK